MVHAISFLIGHTGVIRQTLGGLGLAARLNLAASVRLTCLIAPDLADPSFRNGSAKYSTRMGFTGFAGKGRIDAPPGQRLSPIIYEMLGTEDGCEMSTGK